MLPTNATSHKATIKRFLFQSQRIQRTIMRFMIRLALFSASLWTVDAFTGHSRPSRVSLKHTGTTSTTLQARGLFVPNLPNPFADLQQGDVNPFGKGFEDDKPFDPSPEGLIRQAKKVLSAELGLLDPSLLDDNEFKWIGPYVDRPLDKTDYLAAGRFFAITTAFPDLNFRAHDFRVDDDDDAATVRMTCRTTGTMRGELRLRDEILPPTGNVMSCPPEAVSLTFDLETGKVVKICSGFCMDRVVGNTDGTTGVMAAASTGGKPISNWEVYPPLTVLQRIFGRPEAPIEEVKNFLAPFPETVMIQLAKGILTSNMAAEDPSLLSEDFVFSTPSAGPIGKKEFVAKYAPEEFNGIQPKFRNYRVDPYDPNRVWVDVTPTGPGYVGSPQAMSFAFDADGFCTRITSWYVMDPTVGNGGGLGGPEGFKFAQGSANEFAARPLPRILGRVKNSFLDLFRPKGKKKMPVPVSIPPPPPPPKKPVAAAVPKPSTPVQRLATSTTPSSAPVSSERERLPIPLQKLAKSFGTINLLEMQRESAAQRKQREPPKTKTATKTTGVAQSFKDQFAKQKEALTAQAKALQVKQKETNAALKKQEEEAARKKQAVELAQKRKQEQAAAAAEQKRKQQQEAAAAAAHKRQQQEVAEQQRRQQLEQQKGLAAQKAAEQKARREAQAKAQADKRAVEQKRREDAARKAANAEAKRIAQEKARQEQELAKKVASEKKKRELEERKQADLEKKQKLAQERALKEQRLAQQREMERKKNERIESEKRKQEERVRLAKQAKKEETVLKALSKSPVVSTFRLFGLGGSDDDADDSDIKAAPVRMQSGVKKAPRGVPMLSRWRRNLDGSVSGFVSGSRSFANGERITTSPIKSGNLSSGEVVVTGSGSKYFLE